MVYVNKEGYLERRTSRKVKRNWWLIKHHNGTSGYAALNFICLPKHLIGKKLRFKVEVME